MGARFWHMSLIAGWIFLLCFRFVFSKQEIEIRLESTVFVAFAGQDLHIDYMLKIPVNHSRDFLVCYDPFNTRIYVEEIPAGEPQTLRQRLELKNLTVSGEYVCSYESALAFWFLRLRDEGNDEPEDNTEFIVVAVLTGILLVFSVISSVFVFSGHWKQCITKRGDGKQKQNKEEKKKEIEEDIDDVKAVQVSSFYASLDARPGSIYDVLDRSPSNRDQKKVMAKKMEPKNTMVQSTKPQYEDGVECVYENF